MIWGETLERKTRTDTDVTRDVRNPADGALIPREGGRGIERETQQLKELNQHAQHDDRRAGLEVLAQREQNVKHKDA
jgi:hypothetical protein